MTFKISKMAAKKDKVINLQDRKRGSSFTHGPP